MGAAKDRGSSLTMLDPTAPIPVELRTRRSSQFSRQAQRERRARILAVTRCVIAQDVEDDVTIRDVANRSNVSAQTIYNLIGNRAQLVEDAINEHIINITSQAHMLRNYPNIFLAIADIIWLNIVNNPEYGRNVTNASHGRYFHAYKKICDRNSRLLESLLKREYAEQTDSGADLLSMARHITSLVGASALDWARGLYDLSELRHRFAFAYGAPLMMLAQSAEADEIRLWLRDIRKAGDQFPGWYVADQPGHKPQFPKR